MIKNIKKFIIICITLFFVGASIAPSISAIDQYQTDEKILVEKENNMNSFSDNEWGNLLDNSFNIYEDKLYDENVELNPPQLYSQYDKQTYNTDEIIVKLKDTKSNNIELLNKRYSIESINQLFKEKSSKNDEFGLSNIYLIKTNDDISQVIQDLNKDENVEYAEPNGVYSAFVIPNDMYFEKQWSLHNTAQTGGMLDADIDAPEAWDIETGSSDIVVAIVDSGVDYTHPDLVNQMWINRGEDINGNGIVDKKDFNGKDDDRNGFVDDIRGWNFVMENDDPFDDMFHGTHCAGIVAAESNNEIGIAGVSWDAKIMPVKCLDSVGSGMWDWIADGIVYAADNNADIISMSLGGGYSHLIEDAVNYAYDKGVVIITAAGNDWSDRKSYPAGHENAIAIAATNHYDVKAGFSNFGWWVDVAAPGVDIYSTVPSFYPVKYNYLSGTSMACPHVAGIAALILSKNPGLSQGLVKSILVNAVDIIDSPYDIGTGRVNSYEAVRREPGLAYIDIEYDSPYGEEVSGTLDIYGTVYAENFMHYVLSYGEGSNPNEWIEVVISRTQVEDGFIGVFDTMDLNEDLYTIRLDVVCSYNDISTLETYTYTDTRLVLVNNECNTFIVDDDNTEGPWYGTEEFPYDYIQDAIFRSGSCDEVFVHSGTYAEDVRIDRPVKLTGENKENTFITQDWWYYGIYVGGDANNVYISGFTIVDDSAPVFLSRVSNATIVDMNFEYGGIIIGSDDYINGDAELEHWNTHTIENVYVQGKPVYYYKNNYDVTIVPEDAGQVILANCSHFTIQNLVIQDNVGVIIQLGYSPRNTIINNIFDSDRVYYAICLRHSSFNTISGNTIMDSKWSGIQINHFSNNNIISENTITYCDLTLAYSSGNIVESNQIQSAGTGIFLLYANNNRISDNFLSGLRTGILVALSKNNIFTDNTITENGVGIRHDYSSHTIINDNNFINNSVYGLIIYFSYSVTIDNNEFINDSIITIDMNVENLLSNTVTNNYVNNKPFYYFKNRNDFVIPNDAGAVIVVNCSNVRLQNYQNVEMADYPVQFWFTSDIIISDCTIANHGNGVYFAFVSNAIVDDCYFVNNLGQGVLMEYSSNCEISDCSIFTSSICQGGCSGEIYGGFAGIYFAGLCTDNVINNCEIFHYYKGIVMEGPNQLICSVNNLVQNCNIHDNAYGLKITSGYDNTIMNNDITHHQFSGLQLGYTTRNIVVGNTISGSRQWHGITIYASYNNVISNNVISNNAHFASQSYPDIQCAAITIFDGTEKNYLYNNNFINNFRNAIDYGSNEWDNGYPSGGNFWDDYLGYDTNNNGLCEPPYIINDNRDRHPLQNPWTDGSTPEVPSPNIVYIDDDFDETISGWNYNRFDIIQNGVDAVSEYGDVIVNNGVYTENTVIDRTMNVVGKDNENTHIRNTIYIQNTDNVTIQQLNISESDIGIVIENSCDIEIFKNKINNNFQGIVIEFSESNTISNNNIYQNSEGIHISDECANNFIYHNFFNNTLNAYDSGTNIWNKAYPFGGNNWGDDYDGDDIYYGIDQNYPGSDGIGDIPYNISGGYNQDRYPLMHSYYESIKPVINLVNHEEFDNIQDAIDDDDTLEGHFIYVQSGTYYENIIINKRITIIGEDRDTTIIDGDNRLGYTVDINVDGVSVDGFTIRNEAYHGEGIILVTSNSNTISNNNIVDSEQGKGVTLDENTMDNNIVGNLISGNHLGIYTHESSSNIIDNNIIIDNIYGIRNDDAFGIIISNNVISNMNSGISIGSSSSDIKIIDNDINNNPISLNGATNIEIRNNEFTDGGITIGNGYGISNWNTHIITNNNINGKPIYYYKNIHEPLVVPNDAGTVILANCSNITIQGLEITDGSTGIILGFSSNNMIFDNTISDNDMYGISLQFSDNNTISYNDVVRNWKSIDITFSSNNSIYGNLIAHNEFSGLGINAFFGYSAINNRVYHNNFVDNPHHLNEYGYEDYLNMYDNGYPSGGNFYDDYNGIDDDNDGIGDTPYTFNYGGIDNYPLMNMYIPGDFNHNGIGQDDLDIFMLSFGSSEGDPNYNPECDYDNDDVITMVDYQIWIIFYNQA